MPSATLLDDLFRRQAIQLDRGALFDSNVTPKPPGFDFDRALYAPQAGRRWLSMGAGG